MNTNKETILVVDDDPHVLMALDAELSDYYNVTPVMSAEQALAHLQSKAFSAIVSDVQMPGIDGLSLIRQCAVRHPDMVRVILTAYDDEDVQETALGPHGAYKLIKPWQDDLLVTLQYALKQRGSKLALKRSLDLRSEALDMDLRFHLDMASDEIIPMAASEMSRLPEVLSVAIYDLDPETGEPKDPNIILEGPSIPKLVPKRLSPTAQNDKFVYTIPIGVWPKPISAISVLLETDTNDIVRYLEFIGRQAFRTLLLKNNNVQLSYPKPEASDKNPQFSAYSDDETEKLKTWLRHELATPTTIIVSVADALESHRIKLSHLRDSKTMIEEIDEIILDLSSTAEDLKTLRKQLKSQEF